LPILSAQQVDPLSWFTGPFVPLSLAVFAAVYSSIVVAIGWGISDRPWLQVVAAMLCTSSGLIVHYATRPMRQSIGWATSALALAPSVAGMLLSALDYSGSELEVEFWWAPGTLALAFTSLAPYVSARMVLVLGGLATTVAVLGSVAILHAGVETWGPIGLALVSSYQPVLGLVATAVFSHTVVTTMLGMLEKSSRIMVAGQTIRDEAAARVEKAMVAQLTARAVPFLQSIISSGRISPSDRALAGQLARRLRDDLVTQSRISWLDSVASESRLVIVDPDRRARRLNHAQRSALRGMLGAILNTPGADRGSLMVDLREGPNSTTAVGVSLDMALPEGRRIMHLAPHYLALQAAVNDLSIDTRDLLRLSFTVDSRDESP
jgi:hypothetical protein